MLNSVAAATQVLLASAAVFVGYYQTVRYAGAEALGMYSLLLAISTLPQVLSIGVASGVSRHIAHYLGTDRTTYVRATIGFSFLLAVAGPAIGAGILASGIFYWSSTLVPEQQSIATQLAPWMCIASILLPASATAQAVVDGLNMGVYRALVVIAASTTFVGISLTLIPRIGIVGLAAAYCAQHALTVIGCSHIALRFTRCNASSRVLPRSLMREQIRFNAQLQGLTLPTLAFDVTVKLFLARSTSLSYVALYEIVNRLMQQTNAILLAANQVLVPLLAFRLARGELQLARSFRVMLSSAATLALLAFGLAFMSTPLLGMAMFDDSLDAFVATGAVLAAAWFFNSLAGPGYFMAIALDKVARVFLANYATLGVILIGGYITSLTDSGKMMPVVLLVAFAGNCIIISYHASRMTGAPLYVKLPSRLWLQAVLTILASAAATLWAVDLRSIWPLTVGTVIVLAAAIPQAQQLRRVIT